MQGQGKHKLFSSIEKIVSGGQTGVDRAALDVALELGISCGGWCSKGRKAEDGLIDIRYPLKETPSANYRIRTERNVRESEGTLIFTWREPKGGPGLTIKFAQKYKKPYFLVDLSVGGNPESVRRWGEVNKINVLNIAGLRESELPGIYHQTVQFVRELFNKTKT